MDCRRPYRMLTSLEAAPREPGALGASAGVHVVMPDLPLPLPATFEFTPMVEAYGIWGEEFSADTVFATPLNSVQLAQEQLQVSGLRLKDYAQVR